jgi:hypothetical protein
MRLRAVTGFLLLFGAVSGLQAQTLVGVIAGTVRDESKKVLPNAAITIMNLETRTIKSATSGPDGSYLVGNLKPGKYMIGAEATGFSATAVALSVVADKAATADLALTLAPVVEADAEPAPALAAATAVASVTPPAAAPAATSSASVPTPSPVASMTPAPSPTAAATAGSAPVDASTNIAGVTTTGATNSSAINLSSMARRQAFWRELLTGKRSTSSQPVYTASLSTPPVALDPPKTLARADIPAFPDAQAPPPPAAPAAPATPPVDLMTPFAFGDFTWMNAVSRNHDSVLDGKYFSGEFRVDTNYIYDYNHPIDHTLGGTTEGERTGEVVLQQLNIGGDFHWDHMQGRILTQLGATATAVPRNDASPALGQWDLANMYRYITEGYAGYHMDVQHGLNIQAGIFMSYIGLFSYYSFDNWSYQPSYVSSNTPWFFNGFRVQWFPTNKLKIEPWIINGWQSYGKFNGKPGIGGQVLWRPTENLDFVWNTYALGQDTLYTHRTRLHEDDSMEWKYWQNPNKNMHRMAFSITFDIGCETGGGQTVVAGNAPGAKVNCAHTGKDGTQVQNFIGAMAYHRWWFDHDKFGATIGGGWASNPGRYLVLLPPVNGATAITGTPYFTQNPGDKFAAYDVQATFDWMPTQFVTWRMEWTQRGANIPYFSGAGGMTPPGGNNGNPSALIDGWSPDFRKQERRWIFSLMVHL